MQDVIKQLFDVIPEYLINFFKFIASPRQFPLGKLPKDESETRNSLVEALKYIKSMDKNLYDALLQVKDQKATFNPEWWNNITYQIGFSILVFGYLIASIWAVIGWGAYRIMNNFSRGKSFAVLLVTGIFSWIAIGISFLIISGLKR